MGGSRTYLFPILLAASLMTVGCIDQLEENTARQVTSMNSMDQNMNKHMSEIAGTLKKFQETADKALINIESQAESFEANFQQGLEKIESMADSIGKLDRLLEMTEYVKRMSEQFDGMAGTFEKIDELVTEISTVMDNLSINLEPKEDEQFDDFFDESVFDGE